MEGARTVKVGPKGQVVIPKKIREEMGIAPGDRVVVYELEGAAQIAKHRTARQLRGVLKHLPGDPLAELEAEHRAEVDEQHAEQRANR
ncbi:MAG: AbrB/MazE/SpoVT family DNA-binding domain-containing protein [Solirubrobacterales bacterium]|jgi:AbrB family looped-hinge helix DNA binding protein